MAWAKTLSVKKRAPGCYLLVDKHGAVHGEANRKTGARNAWFLKLNGIRWANGDPCTMGGFTTKQFRSLIQCLLTADQIVNGEIPVKGQQKVQLKPGVSKVVGEIVLAKDTLDKPAATVDVVQRMVLGAGCQVLPVTPADIDKSIIDGEFRKAWAEKEAQGFRYGPDALEQVRMGFAMGMRHIAQQDAKLPPVAVAPSLAKLYPHYHKDVRKFESIDVYRVLALWEVTDPCLQHAIKKLLAAGQRGAKDVRKDVREAMVSCQRFLEMQAEDDTL